MNAFWNTYWNYWGQVNGKRFKSYYIVSDNNNNSFYLEAPFKAPLQFIKYSKERFKTVQKDYTVQRTCWERRHVALQ